MNKKKRIVIALGGNALGNTLPEQMAAVKVTSKAIVDTSDTTFRTPCVKSCSTAVSQISLLQP